MRNGMTVRDLIQLVSLKGITGFIPLVVASFAFPAYFAD